MFPANAGVIPCTGTKPSSQENVPRKRGGDPKEFCEANRIEDMFPANAGVIPNYYREHGLSLNVPRKRGGDPREGRTSK